MSLSTEARRRLEVALTDEKIGKEVADKIDAGGNPDVATTTANGLMSSADKTKLDGIAKATAEADGLLAKENFSKLAGIEAEANKYVLPAAVADTIGGVKLAANVPEAAGANPTAAEFKALLDALIAAGVMAAAA